MLGSLRRAAISNRSFCATLPVRSATIEKYVVAKQAHGTRCMLHARLTGVLLQNLVKRIAGALTNALGSKPANGSMLPVVREPRSPQAPNCIGHFPYLEYIALLGPRSHFLRIPRLCKPRIASFAWFCALSHRPSRLVAG